MADIVICKGDVFDTQDPEGVIIETGCVALEDAVGPNVPFLGIDSEGVECQFTTAMVAGVTEAVI